MGAPTIALSALAAGAGGAAGLLGLGRTKKQAKLLKNANQQNIIANTLALYQQKQSEAALADAEAQNRNKAAAAQAVLLSKPTAPYTNPSVQTSQAGVLEAPTLGRQRLLGN